MTQAGDSFDTWQDRYEFPAHARRATLVFSEPNEMRMGAYQFTVRLRRRGMRTRTWSCAGTPSGLDPWSFDDRYVAFACWDPEYDGWWLERCAVSGPDPAPAVWPTREHIAEVRWAPADYRLLVVGADRLVVLDERGATQLEQPWTGGREGTLVSAFWRRAGAEILVVGAVSRNGLQILDATSGRVMHSVDLEEHLPELPRETGPSRGYIVDRGPGLRGDEGLLMGWWHATYDLEGGRLRLGYHRQDVPGTPLLTEFIECRVGDLFP